MNVKERVISEIDDLLFEYTERSDSMTETFYEEKDHHAIWGAIDALNTLKKWVEGINIDEYKTMRVVEKSSSELSVLRLATGFLSEVLFRIEVTLKDKALSGDPGSGANPDAMPGRREVCRRVREFVYKLDAEL